MESQQNQIYKLAADIVAHTSQSVFLTGKAGTGKTTFLHHIKLTVDKNIIVAAPTGVAAINAGGVTLHSLLQLPFEPFIPNAEGKLKLDHHFKLRKSKIEMLRELELLIIDEVSMLRADMLDAVDYMLKKYRNNQQAFGGVQMLFIGDLFQLPPVVQNHEWSTLNQYYASPFFFHAQALNAQMPLYIELKTIYRQSDLQFIEILNNIRNNEVSAQNLIHLNAKYNPNFIPPKEEHYVTLCTHNARADRINKMRLDKLPDGGFLFKGVIKGNFSENSYPTDLDLYLRKGAQIMFVKNDSGEKKRYYNGKLGKIVALSGNDITVEFPDKSIFNVEKETWRNVRYVLNEESGAIEEEELGYFSQYPIRLAWAITIHKSQGLTFDKVIIDAEQAFAAGQVYVALSRCTSLDGIVLYSKITPQAIQTDEEALRFGKSERNISELTQVLEREKPLYIAERLKMHFDWAPLVRATRAFYELVQERQVPDKEEILGMASIMCNKAREQEAIAQAFHKELDHILYNQKDIGILRERVQKASKYFHQAVLSQLIEPFGQHLDSLKNAARIKLYLRRAQEIYASIETFLQKLEKIYYGDIHLTEGLTFKEPKIEIALEQPPIDKPAFKKGETQRLTLTLYQEGKSVPEISKERNLKPITVEGHLAQFVKSGEVQASDLIGDEKVKALTPLMQQYTLESALKSIKENIPEHYSYFEIKVMLNHLHQDT